MIKFYKALPTATNPNPPTDLYTMDVRTTNAAGTTQHDLYSFSANPLSPLGVNQFNGTYQTIIHADQEIDFDDLPDDVQTAVAERLTPPPHN